MNDSSIIRLAYRIESKIPPKDIFLSCLTGRFIAERIGLNPNYTDISASIKKGYGLDIPSIILETWIKKYYEPGTDGIYLPKGKSIKDVRSDIKENKRREETFSKSISSLREDFIQYARDQFRQKISKEETKKIFSQHKFLNNTNEDNITSKNKNHSIYQFYIRDVCRSDENKRTTLENLGIANQFTEIALGEDIESSKFLDGCLFYLDTPLLIRLFGYDGKQIAESYLQVIELLHEWDVSLLAFEHTFDEMWGILFSWKKNISLKRFDAKGVNTYLKALKEGSEEEIPLDKDKIRGLFEKYKITIIAKESFESEEDWKNVLDEENLEQTLKRYIRWENYPNRITKDLDSISSIQLLRKGNTLPETYQDGKYFLLTDNWALREAVKDFMSSPPLHIKIPVELLDFLSIFIWQNRQEHPDLSRNLFRTKCFSFIEVDDQFKKKLYERASHLERNSYGDLSQFILAYPEFEDIIYRDYWVNTNDFDYDVAIKDQIRVYENTLRDEGEDKANKKNKEDNWIKNQERDDQHAIDLEKAAITNFEAGKEEGKKRERLMVIKERLWYRILTFFSETKAQSYLDKEIKKFQRRDIPNQN